MDLVHDIVRLQGPYVDVLGLHEVPPNEDLNRLAFHFMSIRKSTCTLNFNNAELYDLFVGLSEDRKPAYR